MTAIIKMALKLTIIGIFSICVVMVPTLCAGINRAVKQKTSVTLDGSGSFDPDGASLKYFWSQTSPANNGKMFTQFYEIDFMT